jgi:hypothetical protein
MSTTTGLPPSVAAYLDALRAELADLAPEERDDLLSEVEPSLLEAAAEGNEPVAARLGPAADFAADLRASAGLPPAPRPAPARTGLAAWLLDLARRPAVVRTVAVLRELAPVWWVARAYVAVAMLAIVLGEGAQTVGEWSRYPEVPRVGGPVIGVVVLALALVASIAAGLAARRGRARGRARGAFLAANLLLAALAIPVADQLRDTAAMRTPAALVPVSTPAPAPTGFTYDGITIDNVYPYDRSGRLLHDVRLYDSRGRPLDFDLAGPDRRPVRDAKGASVLNAYPVRYFEPGTHRVAHPQAGSPVTPPRLTTPPVRRPRKHH